MRREDIERYSKYICQGSDSVEYESIGFKEKIEIVEVDTKIGNIQDEKSPGIHAHRAVEKTYAVQSGDTLSGIAKNSAYPWMILRPQIRTWIPPGCRSARADPHQTLSRAYVQTTEIAEYKVPIDYDIVYEETSAL